MCRINNNNNTYWLSSPCWQTKIKWAVTRYRPLDITEASLYIYIHQYIHSLDQQPITVQRTDLTTCSNVHKISPSLVLELTPTHNLTGCATEYWLIATKLYISTQMKFEMREPWHKLSLVNEFFGASHCEMVSKLG